MRTAPRAHHTLTRREAAWSLAPLVLVTVLGLALQARINRAAASVRAVDRTLNEIDLSIDRLDGGFTTAERLVRREDTVSASPVLLPAGGAFNLVADGNSPGAIFVGTIQPTTVPGAGPDQRALIKNMRLIASRVQDAVIGGLPADAPDGQIPAPILIEDCIIDPRIHLGENVKLGSNVRFSANP